MKAHHHHSTLYYSNNFHEDNRRHAALFNKPRHVTARSRFVEMISRNYNPYPVSDTRFRS
jgi:hypothetical protein